MSMEALSGDIFSILRKFTSPRMGQFDNTNAPRPMPPKAEVKANTDAARAMSDPTRYGATGADAGTGLVPQPPGPGGPMPPPQPVARRVVPPGAKPPAATAEPDPATTGAVQPPPRQPPPAPTDGSAAAALVNAPDTPAAPAGGGGEFDFIYNNPIYKFQRLQQQRAYEENERSQRMDNLVSGLGKIAGAATGVGGGGIKVRGDISSEPTLTFDQLKDLSAQKAEAERGVAMRNVADIIAKQNPGMSRAAIEAMILAKPEKFADLGFNLADPKARADAMKTLADTVKVEQSLAGPGANSLDVLKQTAKDLGKDPEDPKVIEQLSQMSITERQDMLSKVLAARETSRGGEIIKLHGATIKDTTDVIKTARQNITERAQRRALVEQGIISGAPGSELEVKVRQFLSGGMDEKSARTQAYLSLSANEALTLGQKMKGSFSDRDLSFLRDAVAGNLTMNNETIQRVLALRDIADRKQLNEAIEERSRARGAVGMPDVGDDRYGPLQQHELRVVNADYLADAMKSEGGRKYFESLYGKEHAEELIQRAGEVAAFKMVPEDYAKMQSAPLESLKANRAEYERHLEELYPGTDTKGVVDLIITMREGKK